MRNSKETQPPNPDSIERPKKFEAINRISDQEPFEQARLIRAREGQLAFGTEAGGRRHQEDALFVDTENDTYAVIDGMSGHERGEEAAQIVAEEIQRTTQEQLEPQTLHQRAHRRMQEAGIKAGGAPYFMLQVKRKKTHLWWAGDCRLAKLDRTGNLTFPPFLISLDDVPTRISRGKQQSQTMEHKNGDRYILASDGLWDNITEEEVIATVQQKSIDEAIKALSEKAKINMHGQRSDGSFGNPDNITIIIYEILPAS